VSPTVPRLIVFDVNETLSDMAPLRDRFEDVDLPPHAAETWFSGLLRDGFALTVTGANPSFAALARASLVVMLHSAVSGRSPDDLDRAADHVLDGLRSLSMHPDVAPGLLALHDRGHRLVTLSNGSADVADTLLAEAGVRGVVERVLSVEDAPRWTPAPEAYGYALDVCGVDDPAEATLVAVHPWDLHGAHEAGLRTAWISRSAQRYPDHFATPDLVATSVEDLADQLA
jgi:2-haloacid dehalogenase